MTRVAIRCFAATVAAAMALSGAAVAGDMSYAEKIKKMDTNKDGSDTAAEIVNINRASRRIGQDPTTRDDLYAKFDAEDPR